MAQDRAIKVLMEDLGLTIEEAQQMINEARKNKMRVEEDSEHAKESDIASENEAISESESIDTGTDKELLKPEDEVEEDIPPTELDSAKQMFGNASTEDFMSVDKPAGQTVTLKAADFPALAKANIGTDTFLVIRGPLVGKQEDTVTVGFGKAALITKSE